MSHAIKKNMVLISAMIGISILSTSALANNSIMCRLGETCNIPEKIGDTVSFIINKTKDGDRFKCHIKAADGRMLNVLSVGIKGGGSFNVREGFGMHVIKNGEADIIVGGYYTLGQTEGSIDISRVFGDGTVRCVGVPTP